MGVAAVLDSAAPNADHEAVGHDAFHTEEEPPSRAAGAGVDTPPASMMPSGSASSTLASIDFSFSLTLVRPAFSADSIASCCGVAAITSTTLLDSEPKSSCAPLASILNMSMAENRIWDGRDDRFGHNSSQLQGFKHSRMPNSPPILDEQAKAKARSANASAILERVRSQRKPEPKLEGSGVVRINLRPLEREVDANEGDDINRPFGTLLAPGNGTPDVPVKRLGFRTAAGVRSSRTEVRAAHTASMTPLLCAPRCWKRSASTAGATIMKR